MAKGFIFNHNLCVACSACIAACALENKWPFRPRTVYTINSDANPRLPVEHISLACNHCKKAICLEGCPASAYHVESSTGAILLDEEKCIGCKYCQWNCPYDAPKYQIPAKVIGKCNYCHNLLLKNLDPACVTACPTGALAFGDLTGINNMNKHTWLPEKNLGPALALNGKTYPPPTIIPAAQFADEEQIVIRPGSGLTDEWSLVAFSFLTILSVAISLSALIKGLFHGMILSLVIVIAAALVSLLHLGRMNRAWRAVTNLRQSPLSMEIALFLFYLMAMAATVILQIPLLLVVSSVSGLVLLLSIDRVYIFTDNRKSVWLHSGQSFLTGLLITSYLTGMIIPFSYIAAVKLAGSLYYLIKYRTPGLIYNVRFIRSALLVITGTSFFVNAPYQENSVILLFLAGEFLDRVLFYVDFKPLNIIRYVNNTPKYSRI